MARQRREGKGSNTTCIWLTRSYHPQSAETMWVATAAVAVYCAKKVREENDPAKIPLMGVLGRVHLCCADAQLHHPGDGFERSPGGWSDPCDLVGALCGLPDDRISAHRPGALLCGRGPARAGLQHLQPWRLPGVCRVSDLQDDREGQVDDRAGHRGQHRRCRGGPAARVALRSLCRRSLSGISCAAVRHLRRC